MEQIPGDNVAWVLIDPPVSPHSDAIEIHYWLDKLERMREDYGGSPSAVTCIEREIAKAVGWLQGTDAL